MKQLWRITGDVLQYCIVAVLWLLGAVIIASLVNWLVFYSSNWRMSVLIGCGIMMVITIISIVQQR